MLELCRKQIEEDNKKFGLNCTPPAKVPIFVGPYLDVKFEVDYEEFYEAYWLNPYRLGIADGKFEVQFFPPYSLLVIPEAQRYFDSRQSGTFSPRVSGLFEKHRHQKIEIILDAQRPDLIDLNIRRLAHKFVEMRGVENAETETGRIVQSTFHCREFTSWTAVNDYLNGTGTDYEEKTYVHRGDIFRCYDSYACSREFMPIKRENYDFLPSYADAMKIGIPKGFEDFYNLNQPEGYRSKKAC